MPKPIIVDAHQDIAYNRLYLNRDITRPLAEIIAAESPEMNALHGTATVSIHEIRRANIGILFGTLFAGPKTDLTPAGDRFHYENSDQAFELYKAQLDVYDHFFSAAQPPFIPLRDQTDLQNAVSRPELGENDPAYLMISIEGADCVRNPEDLRYFWDRGVRAIGPAWQRTRHCGGTDQPGGLTADGIELLKNMDKMGFILDLSHMDWLAIHPSFDVFGGTIIASHANVFERVTNATRNRFLPDNILRKLIDRGGVIGVIPFKNFLYQYWSVAEPKPTITIDTLVDHIDHICQLAGNTDHVGIGSDFDGGFGAELIPDGMNSIADLTKIGDKMTQRGYKESDVEKILGGNWIRILRGSLP